jgi:hypothetical protein
VKSAGNPQGKAAEFTAKIAVKTVRWQSGVGFEVLMFSRAAARKILNPIDKQKAICDD